MANQSQTDATLNPRQSTKQAIAAGVKALQALCLVAIALFVFVGTIHADILVSNHATGCIGLYNDDGTYKNGDPHNACFISTSPDSSNTAEGMQCVKLSSNAIYVASAKDNILREYDLTTGRMINQYPVTGAQGFGSLATNAAGTVLYLEDSVNGNIIALDLPPSQTSPCSYTNPCSVPTLASHDAVVGPDGYVYATNFGNNTGVLKFQPYIPDGIHRWSPGAPSTFIPRGTPGQCMTLPGAGAMVFDGGTGPNGPNLWVANVDVSGLCAGILEFTGPYYSPSPNRGTFLNLTLTPGSRPFGLDVSPVNPPGLPKDSCMGCIVATQYAAPGYPGGTVVQIDPTMCNNGECTTQNLITMGLSGPKYVRFTENCCDTGYVEVCKNSCLTDPVTGNFDFTVTNQGAQYGGPLSIPVNACSGPIQIPNGTVTIHETQLLGMEVSDITAYDYDYRGYQISALLSFNLPFQTGNVDVVSGDVSTETVAGFTNCASGPGELKICKVAGPGVMVGTLFSFTASGDPTTYHVPAGPAPDGYCVVGMSYPVGTPVLVTELPQQGYVVSGITVAPPDRGGMQTSNSVIAIIDSGTTEVTFTNRTSGGLACVGACGVR